MINAPARGSHTKKRLPPFFLNLSDKKTRYTWLVVAATLFVVLNILVYSVSKKTARPVPPSLPVGPATPTVILAPTVSTTPTPRPIPHGKITFTVSMSNKTGPLFFEGFLDPYDPAVGEKQTISIQIRSAVAVASVTATVKLDSGKTVSAPMKLAEGTDTDGRYEASVTIPSSYLYTYNLVFASTDSAGAKNTVEVTLR